MSSWAERVMEEIIDRAWTDVQMNQAVNGLNITDDDKLRDAFLLGCYHALNCAVEYFDEQGWLEQHTGPDYDYLYEEE